MTKTWLARNQKRTLSGGRTRAARPSGHRVPHWFRHRTPSDVTLLDPAASRHGPPSHQGGDGHKSTGSSQRVGAGALLVVAVAVGGEEDDTQSQTLTHLVLAVWEKRGKRVCLDRGREGQNGSVPVHLRDHRERKVDKCRWFCANCSCTNLNVLLAVG
jgi:hypothetical protein